MYLYPRGKAISVLTGGDGFTKVEVPPVSFADCKHPIGDELQTFVRRLLGTFYYQGFKAISANVRLAVDGLYYITLEVTANEKHARAIDMIFGYRAVISDDGYLSIENLNVRAMGKENLIPPAITASAIFAVEWNYSKRATEIAFDLGRGYECAALASFDNIDFQKELTGEYLVQNVPSIHISRLGVTCVAKAVITHDEDGPTIMVYPLRQWIDNLRSLGLTDVVKASFGFNGITLQSGSRWKITDIASAQITVLILEPWQVSEPKLDEGLTVVSELKSIEVETVEAYSERKQEVEYPRLYPLVGHERVIASHVTTVSTPLGDHRYGFLKTGSFDLLATSQCARQDYAVAPDVVVARLLVQAKDGTEFIIEPRDTNRFTFCREYGKLGLNDESHNQQRDYVLRGKHVGDSDVTVTFRGTLGSQSGTGQFNARITNDETLKVIGWEPITYGVARARWVTDDSTPNLAESIQDIAYGAYLSGLPEGVEGRTREQFVNSFDTPVTDIRTALTIARGMSDVDAKVFTSSDQVDAESVAVTGKMMRAESPNSEQ